MRFHERQRVSNDSRSLFGNVHAVSHGTISVKWDGYSEAVIVDPSGLRDASNVTVEINGSYGDWSGGDIHILKDGVEVVMWDSQEWVEDHSLVYVIANAIRKAYEGKL